MTELATTRFPLQVLSMSSSQRPPRRRSARLAFDEENGEAASKRTKLNENASGPGSNSSKSPSAARKPVQGNRKPKPSYKEDVDGFIFARSSKTKNNATHDRTSSPSEALAKPDQDQTFNKNKTLHPRRRSARLSGEKVAEEKVDKSQVTTDQSTDTDSARKTDVQERGRSPDKLHVERKRETTKIALPFADTPIIARNKAMRKSSAETHRRSSSQLRGRRASSLMDSGTSNALPHSEVETTDFYKHIGQDLPEPRRMRQLLVWCGTRALPERPTGGTNEVNAALAARVIQEELLKDFSNNGDMSDWFNRDDTTATALSKKANPRNMQNAAKLLELEREVERLKQEQKNWETMIDSLDSGVEQQDEFVKQQTTQEVTASTVDGPLLSAGEQSSLANVSSTEVAELEGKRRRVEVATNWLEFKVDHFAERIHRVVKFQETVNGLADQVLSDSSHALDEKDKLTTTNVGTEKVGVRDLLRSLSRKG